MIQTLQYFSRPIASSVISHASVGPSGALVAGASYGSSFSANGRYMLFSSNEKTWDARDTNNNFDIFRKDLLTGEIILVSTTKAGTVANGESVYISLSADGRYALFRSTASNLVDNDPNGATSDIFRKDLITGDIIRISSATGGGGGNGSSSAADMDASARYVVFESQSTDLVSGDVNAKADIFRKDLSSGETIRVSTTENNGEGNNSSQDPSISADGRYVVFTSAASNLVAGDTNERTDIFRKDLLTNEVICISSGTGGIVGNGNSADAQISANGRYVVFESSASNLGGGGTNGATDIFRKDLETGEIVCVSTSASGTEGNDASMDARISADGRYVVFSSLATNLVANQINGKFGVFRKDLATGEIIRLSAAADGTNANDNSFYADISADGRYVGFSSLADNLATRDINNSYDVFLVDTFRLPNALAIADGRFVELSLGVGAASTVSLAWGDGSVDTIAPAGGSAAFKHTYAATGLKAAVATVYDGAQSWSVPYLIDLGSGTMTRNAGATSQLTGSSGRDSLTGDAFADRISGGYGNDVLTGGLGQDVFVFDSRLGTSTTDRKVNFDTVVKFNVKDDTIQLDNAIFKKLGKPGKLNKKYFSLDKAKQKDDYLVYSKKTGVLTYDADGSGSKKAIEIAKLDAKLKITAADFFVI